MSTTTTTDQAERIVGALRAHEAELRRAGIRHLSLFGSFGRGDAGGASDIDLAAEFDSAVRMAADGARTANHGNPRPAYGPVARTG
jgi:predicted nucleotidyltransferase